MQRSRRQGLVNPLDQATAAIDAMGYLQLAFCHDRSNSPNPANAG